MDFPDSPAPQPKLDPPTARLYAIIEIVLCSGVPSQFALTYLIALAGFSPFQGGRLSFGYVTSLLLLDATLMIAMIFWFLHRHGEKPRDVFLGNRPIGDEVRLGIPMTGVVFVLAMVVLTTAQKILPSLHNVPENPLQQLIATRTQAFIFTIVATIAGGLREEIQRGFIIHRFDQHLGGAAFGVAAYSVAFGLGHVEQGWDAALATGMLGAIWGCLYMARRSIVAPMVSHAGFNLLQLIKFVSLR